MREAHAGVLTVALVAPAGMSLLSMARTRRLGRLGRRRHPGGADSARMGKPSLVRPAQLAATLAAGAWLVLAATAAGGGTDGFHLTPLVAAAGCGAALLTVGALDSLAPPSSPAWLGVALTAVGVGLTAGGGGGEQAAPLLAGLTVAAAVTIRSMAPDPPRGPRGATARSSPLATRTRGHGRVVTALLATAGVAACGAGFAVLHGQSGRWVLPTGGAQSLTAITTFLGAAALLSASGTFSRRLPTGLLLAGGLAVGLSAAPLRAGADELGAVVVALAAAAVVAAGARKLTLSLALLALAAAAGPATLAPTSRLLAAAAVIAAAVDAPWALLAAVPGAASLGTAVIEDGSRLALAVALAAAVVAVVLAVVVSETAWWTGVSSTPGGHDYRGLLPGAVPAMAVGAWLVVAPGTWTWTGAGLDSYDQGMARAIGAGLLVVMARVLVGVRTQKGETPPTPRQDPAPSQPRPRQPQRQLVRSEGSATTPRPRRAFRSQRARPQGRFPARPHGWGRRAKPGWPGARPRRTRRSRG